MTTMDASIRKKTLRMLSNGIYIVTSSSGARHGAATVTWLSQASFTPPLVMAALRRDSNVFRCLTESGFAVVHILDRGQQEMAQRFFRPTAVVGDTINGEPFVPGITQAPVLKNAAAYFECVLRHTCTLGDHAVVVMEVVDAECRAETSPLTVQDSLGEYGG
ncbi:MAG: flavin reductase [Acidobacteria bacterium]|nr:MAG: flavin reductase [Acidobacteriota bacterium]